MDSLRVVGGGEESTTRKERRASATEAVYPKALSGAGELSSSAASRRTDRRRQADGSHHRRQEGIVARDPEVQQARDERAHTGPRRHAAVLEEMQMQTVVHAERRRRARDAIRSARARRGHLFVPPQQHFDQRQGVRRLVLRRVRMGVLHVASCRRHRLRLHEKKCCLFAKNRFMHLL
eukprot:scaffold1922_cov101-Isochrysis_galbana.AAC.8